MKESVRKVLQGRVFTMSLKPAWTKEYTQERVEMMKGVAEMYVVNHDKDIDENGELIENHTHVVVIYDTPRKITTIANAFGVEPNFVEMGRSKVAILRYLIHKGTPNKYQYSPNDVITNSDIPYESWLEGQSITDKELIEYVEQGREFELLGLVALNKITMAQRLIHNRNQANANTQLAFLREVIHKQNANLEMIYSEVRQANTNYNDLLFELKVGIKDLGFGATKALENLGKNLITLAKAKR
jgi:hypothetical protein